MIHPTAVIASRARIGKDVEIGPYVVIEDHVVVGRGTVVHPFVHLLGHTTIGEHNTIRTGAVIGSPPQDLKYKNEESYVTIGDNNVIREYVTVNPGTAKGETTAIGDNNLIMANVHIAHNCVIGGHCIIDNVATLAGHVAIHDHAIIGGLAGIHQFCRVGKHAFIGGCSKIVKDILPFVIADGNPAVPHGINLIGLRRRGFPEETIRLIEQAYKILFRSGLNTSDAVKKLENLPPSPEIGDMLGFIKESQRGIARKERS